MRTFLATLLVIISLGVLGGAGFLVFNEGFTSGEVTGYENGYYAGEEYGFEWGTQEGYTEGYTIGEEEGYTTGYDIGAAKGFDSGYTEGEEVGYGDGFAQGQTTGYDSGYQSGYSKGVDEALGHGYTLKDPTFAEALAFMRSDTTSENEYIEDDYGVYVCSHFSRDTGNNAESLGYRCAMIELRYIGSGHTIIAFETLDRGLVFFEPQTDEQVNPEIGKRYYQCVVPTPGTYYSEPDYDDTIMDLLIIW